MASLVLSGDTSGSITVSAPAVSGSNTQTLVATTGTLAPIVSATAKASTSGTSVDFDTLPSWVKRITVMFQGVSTNGTSNLLIQIGDSGGVETSGYTGASSTFQATVGTDNLTSGFLLRQGTSTAAKVVSGNGILTLIDGTTWSFFGAFGRSDIAEQVLVSGAKSLSATLDRVRITTVNGTDTFDAGTINILYE